MRRKRAAGASIAALLLLALGLSGAPARGDPSDSILTYGCDQPLPRSAANCVPWQTTPVFLRWTYDANYVPVLGSSCDTTFIDKDTPGTDVTCAVQNAALTRVQKTVTLRVDQTPPAVIGATPARQADRSGWWNHPVAWTFAGSDATSGIAGCDVVPYSGPDSGTGDVAGACRDVAGNSTTGHAAIKYDATPPTVTGALPARAADHSGWWNHAVNWTFQGTDATSGLASCDTVGYSGPDGAAGTVSGDCRDVAGNSATGHASIKYDATAPTVSGATPERAADHAGWWNHAVKWTFQGSDATSLIASCDSVTYAGPDTATGTMDGACRDNAGNATTGHASVKYDATPPTVSSPAIRPADRNGWWNHPVDWTVHGTDATSDIASCDTGTYSGPDLAGATVSGSCADEAGNSATGQPVIFKYDNTPPTSITGKPGRAADQSGWWNHPVTIAFTATDATSGFDSCDPAQYAGPADPAADVTAACRDLAGNSAIGHASIKYDATPPTITTTPDREADHNGWWNHPVGWTVHGQDPTSGIASCDSGTYSGPDLADGTVSGSCTDHAGNPATSQWTSIKYDATPPTITTTPDRDADHNGWWNHPVGWTVHGEDPTSGIASCDAGTYSGPDLADATVSGSCTDQAGNPATSQSASIKYDVTPPTNITAKPDRGADHDGWWNRPVTIAFTAKDATSGFDSCDTVRYAGPADAAADLKADCRDKAGNVATGHMTIKYDADPPTVSALPADVGDNEAVLHWTASPDTVVTDVIRSPGIGDAPASTVYSGNGQSFADPGVKNDVTYTYSIRALDAAANQASATVTLTPQAPPSPEPAPTLVDLPPHTAVTGKPVSPPRLQWRRVKGASYYNVQLYRGARKILSTWPRSTHLQLGMSWKFHGRLMHLAAGNYDWYAWPGFGRRARYRYGHLIVHGKFNFRQADTL